MKHRPSKEWVQSLPYARPAFPSTLYEQLKYVFWRILTPLHPYIRDFLLYIRLLRHQGRQNYLLGRLAPGETVEGVVNYLLQKGYGNHFIAWNDDGQVVSLRHVESFERQYHIRIFEDGEVRGHYEYTPEARPILHVKEIGMEPRFDEFLELLKGRIVPVPFSKQHGFSWSFGGGR
jgi:hypothetical protein